MSLWLMGLHTEKADIVKVSSEHSLFLFYSWPPLPCICARTTHTFNKNEVLLSCILSICFPPPPWGELWGEGGKWKSSSASRVQFTDVTCWKWFLNQSKWGKFKLNRCMFQRRVSCLCRQIPLSSEDAAIWVCAVMKCSNNASGRSHFKSFLSVHFQPMKSSHLFWTLKGVDEKRNKKHQLLQRNKRPFHK